MLTDKDLRRMLEETRAAGRPAGLPLHRWQEFADPETRRLAQAILDLDRRRHALLRELEPLLSHPDRSVIPPGRLGNAWLRQKIAWEGGLEYTVHEYGIEPRLMADPVVAKAWGAAADTNDAWHAARNTLDRRIASA